MQLVLRTLATAAATLALSSAAHAITASEAMNILATNGYVAPTDLQLTSGVWRVTATSQDGVRRNVLIDDANGALSAIDPTALRNGWGLPGAAQVVQALNAAGWPIVKDLEFDNGLWEAEVCRAIGQPDYDVLVHPVTLAILNNPEEAAAAAAATTGLPNGVDSSTAAAAPTPATSLLSAAEIIARLQAAGYTRIHDLEYDDDGYWEADAWNARGQKVDLDISPTAGAVLREKLDD